VDWLIGFCGSMLIAGGAFWRQSLSRSGALAAVVVGTILYALGGAGWYVPLLAFFFSSSLLSKFRRRQKAQLNAMYEKTDRRDLGQVLANGGLGTLLCIAHALFPHPIWWFAYIGIMASVNADTWATEIGGLSTRPPRSVRTGRPVAPGTSGGVTLLGLSASAAGALFIGVFAWLLGPWPPVLVLIALCSGFAGSLADSVMGATVQQMRRCALCGREVEAAVHCGRPTKPVRGLRGMNNDAVNGLSSFVGGLVCMLLAVILM